MVNCHWACSGNNNSNVYRVETPTLGHLMEKLFLHAQNQTISHYILGESEPILTGIIGDFEYGGRSTRSVVKSVTLYDSYHQCFNDDISFFYESLMI